MVSNAEYQPNINRVVHPSDNLLNPDDPQIKEVNHFKFFPNK